MKILPLQNALRTAVLSICLGSTVMLLSSCGGGGGKGGGGSSGGGDAVSGGHQTGGNVDKRENTGGSGFPDQVGGVGAGTGCTANVLNESKYTAITYGMSLSDVQRIVGCKPFDSFQNATVWMSEEYAGAQLHVGVDESLSVIEKAYQGPLSAVPSSMPSSVAQTCTSIHINQNKYNAITNGMSPDEVNQLIGCRPSRVAQIAIYESNYIVSAYDWLILVENQPNPDQVITVGFDDTTGLSTYKSGRAN